MIGVALISQVLINGSGRQTQVSHTDRQEADRQNQRVQVGVSVHVNAPRPAFLLVVSVSAASLSTPPLFVRKSGQSCSCRQPFGRNESTLRVISPPVGLACS